MIDVKRFRKLLPACMRDRDQWVVWRYEERNGKITKVPINAKAGSRASSTDRSTWSTMDESISALRRFKGLEGIGFVFSQEDQFAGVDLDRCIDPETGDIKEWARPILQQLTVILKSAPPEAASRSLFLQFSKAEVVGNHTLMGLSKCMTVRGSSP